MVCASKPRRRFSDFFGVHADELQENATRQALTRDLDFDHVVGTLNCPSKARMLSEDQYNTIIYI